MDCKLLVRAATAALLLTTSMWAQAQGSGSHGGHSETGASGSAASSAAMSEGEVRKVDRETGRITIRHGEIKNLEMPPMTMVFRVKDASLLDTVKEGEKVQFVAERVNGAITVTSLKRAD